MRRQQVAFTPSRLSSGDLPERERVPQWRECWGKWLFRAEIEPVRDAPFHADVTARFLPEIGLISASFSPARMSCIPGMVTDADAIGVVVGSDGFGVSLAGREVAVEAGDAIALATTDAATMSWASSARFRCILVRRAALAPLLPNIDDAVMRPVPRHSEALRYLLGYIRFIEESGESPSPQIAQSASLHLLGLLALALEPGNEAAAAIEARGLRATRLGAIKRFVARHSDDCRLTVNTIASRFNVTPRSVQRLFESEGTTLSKFLLDRRLARAREMLVRPCEHDLSISEVALRAGFGDISYFNRCFRHRFGASPRQFRGTGIADGSGSPSRRRGVRSPRR